MHRNKLKKILVIINNQMMQVYLKRLLSLLMKGEMLASNTHWIGRPAQYIEE
jgi:hypothetical protein